MSAYDISSGMSMLKQVLQALQVGGGTVTVSGMVMYPIVAKGTNPNSLPQGTLVAMPGEPAGTPVGLLLSLTVAAVSFSSGIITAAGAMPFHV